ncbi:MAG: hypothetical protein JWM18_2202 [Chloroflexi bacterium]|jgi:hypothetical protein|nr:hypothetical protein [Chloroflexota bacterium]
MFDVFVARLRCPGCDTVVADAEIQTHIRGSSADSSSLGVGFEFHPLDLTTESLVDSGYAPVNPPDPNGPIRLLDVWICWQCKTEQWAMVEIADRKIRSIEAVRLDRTTLESANFISDSDADLLAEALRRQGPVLGASSMEILRQRLPTG